jgi:gas vesicle protein
VVWHQRGFLCGLVIGGVVGHLYARFQASHQLHEKKKDGGRFMAEIVMRRLRVELDLTEKQSGEIKPLLIKLYQQGHEHLEQTRAEMDKLMEGAMAKVAKHLNKSQLEKIKQKGFFVVRCGIQSVSPMEQR